MFRVGLGHYQGEWVFLLTLKLMGFYLSLEFKSLECGNLCGSFNLSTSSPASGLSLSSLELLTRQATCRQAEATDQAKPTDISSEYH